MGDNGHYRDELQDLLDRRLDAEREREVRSHLDRCPQCRREFEAAAWVKRLAATVAETDLPPGLEDSIRSALPALRPSASRRALLVAAASLVLGAGGAVWLFRRGRQSLPAAVVRDHQLFMSGALPLEIQAARPEAVEAFFRERGVPFRTRVLDLAMMNYGVRGGRVHRLGGRPSALFAYQGDGAKALVCQMYPGRLEELPPADEVRHHRGFRFQIYRRPSITAVFWQEGEVVCVLTGDFGEQEIVALAFEKAML
jgi:anti-sigma factor RsiW